MHHLRCSFIFECSEGKLHEDITTGVFEVLPDFENNETGDEIMVTSFHSSGTPSYAIVLEIQ